MKLGEILEHTEALYSLRQFREEAIRRAGLCSLPSHLDENWRFLDLSTLYHREQHEAAAGASVDPELLDEFSPGTRLVFIDGFFSPELSDSLPAGVKFTRITDIEEEIPLPVKYPENYFSFVNAARFREGCFLEISQKQILHLLHISTNGLVYPRMLVKLQKDATARILEEHAGNAGANYTTIAVAEFFLEENSQLQHVRLENDCEHAFHLGSLDVCQKRSSVYSLQHLALGARISRLDLAVHLQGEGAECRLDGLALASGRQNIDTHSAVFHASPQAKSVQLHKCIADGAAHAVFSGKIWVGMGAIGTDSAQQSRNLLLSANAKIDSQPQLEIYNDDVKCTHGATVGRLDPDALFFLQSRGLDEDSAMSLLTYAFAAEILEKMPFDELALKLGEKIQQRMGERQ